MVVAAQKSPIANWEQIRDEWIARVKGLVDLAEGWARDLGWATRRIEIGLDDPEIGAYRVPALHFQEDRTRLLLEPLGRTGDGGDGVADLYVMPAYDDVAKLSFENGEWHINYLPPGRSQNESRWEPLTRELFQNVAESMRRHVA